MVLGNAMINELASKRIIQRQQRLDCFMNSWSGRFIDIVNKRVCRCLPLAKLIELQSGN